MRFFFYGTLISGCGGLGDGGAVGAALARLGAGRPAVAQGRLYAVPDPDGWYPALQPDPAGGPVHGLVFTAGAGFTAADLAVLDAYEDFRAADPAASEYLRRAVAVTMRGERVVAEAYVYHAPLPPGARVIRGGDFQAFLAAYDLPAYRFAGLPVGDLGG